MTKQSSSLSGGEGEQALLRKENHDSEKADHALDRRHRILQCASRRGILPGAEHNWGELARELARLECRLVHYCGKRGSHVDA